MSKNNIFSQTYYNFKNDFDKLNLSELTDAELLQLKSKAESIQQEYKNFELIVKKDANSLYGTSANIFLSMVDYDVATDTTQTGKHFTVIVDRAINKFFVNWGENELKIIQQFYPNCTGLRKFTQYKPDTINDLCFYGDTDSRYIDLYMIYQLLEGVKFPELTEDGTGDDELIGFGLFLDEQFISKIIEETLINDITARNAKHGSMKMTHEVITRKNIVQVKKKYVFAAIYKDGKKLGKPKMVIKGVELKKGEINPRIKKIIETLVTKLLIEDKSLEYIHGEILKLIKYIKMAKDKSLIYRIVSVSNLGLITFNQDKGLYETESSYLSINVAKSWYNFLHQNNLQNEYRLPFEGQKMNFYIDIHGNQIGVPDDIDIMKIPNLPEPNWGLMINQVLVKPVLRYLKEDKLISEKDIDYFLLGFTDILAL